MLSSFSVNASVGANLREKTVSLPRRFQTVKTVVHFCQTYGSALFSTGCPLGSASRSSATSRKTFGKAVSDAGSDRERS